MPRRVAVVEELAAIGQPAGAPLRRVLEKEIARLESIVVDPPATAASEEVARLRTVLADLRGLPELSKELLQQQGGPALDQLKLVYPVYQRELAQHYRNVGRSKPALEGWRTFFQELAQTESSLDVLEVPWDDYARRIEILIPRTEWTEAAEWERVGAANATCLPGLDPREAAGVGGLNEVRRILGLNPMELDLKLCDAARHHSMDMKALGFFSHESPVPGKETPWARASLAGTTASGENIYAGSESSADAMKGWFFSPGHHKILFSNSRRMGLGRDGGHWTFLSGN